MLYAAGIYGSNGIVADLYDDYDDDIGFVGLCGNDEYLCPEGWCIPMTWRCNGISECANGEDEKLCGKCNFSSPPPP